MWKCFDGDTASAWKSSLTGGAFIEFSVPFGVAGGNLSVYTLSSEQPRGCAVYADGKRLEDIELKPVDGRQVVALGQGVKGRRRSVSSLRRLTQTRRQWPLPSWGSNRRCSADRLRFGLDRRGRLLPDDGEKRVHDLWIKTPSRTALDLLDRRRLGHRPPVGRSEVIAS